ncbi:helix-turn-helix domain-containing protein [Paenibacillus dendritiformis]|uniref:helix-turn-helix domain-containing protein n=1 Tax=Paenibacillus dendritiformis TaxID=130049 RepID=UPI0025E4AD6C|nr:helix-turn-helix transcriptional regulator [uncultured Paenibacillus sp.]MDU5143553.1 helix-turn-helix transcriptional regulator [Paenibacillus dendritiformis]
MGTAVKKNVDRLLKAKGWTRYRLSKESGITMSVIYSLGEKESGPTADKLLKIANALGCTVDELVR